jgi:hypothetical protein
MSRDSRSDLQSPISICRSDRSTTSEEESNISTPITTRQSEDQTEKVHLLIAKAFTMCESVVQDYIVAVSGKDYEFWGFTKIPTPFVEFKNNLDPTLSVKIGLAVVDKEHMFPPDKCRPTAIRNEIVFMLNGLNIVLPHILHSHRADTSEKSVFENTLPEYFNEFSKFMTDPNNLTACLYCGENEQFEKNMGRKPNAEESKAIYRLNNHQKRIGFVLGDANSKCLGQTGHNEVSNDEIISIGSAMLARTAVSELSVPTIQEE